MLKFTNKLIPAIWAILLIVSFETQTASANVCIEEADGFLYGYWTRPMVRTSSGDWARSSSSFKDDFLVKIVGEFSDQNGDRLLYVRVYAPGFSPVCENQVFRSSELYLFAGPRPIDYCLTRIDGFTNIRKTRSYHPGESAPFVPGNRVFLDQFDLEVIETIEDPDGVDPYFAVMISTPHHSSDCSPALVRKSEITLFGEPQ